jgi:hypothetical protein
MEEKFNSFLFMEYTNFGRKLSCPVALENIGGQKCSKMKLTNYSSIPMDRNLKYQLYGVAFG